MIAKYNQSINEKSETEKDIKCRKLLKEKGHSFHKRIGPSEIGVDNKYFEKRESK